MTTAVSSEDNFRRGDRVLMRYLGNDRIPVTVVESLTGGFYQVENEEGQHLLMHDPSDDPVRIGVQETPSRAPWRPQGPPVPVPPVKDPVEFGMSSPDLAVHVADVINSLTDRILGPGKEQYEHTRPDGVVYQNFETMDLPTLILYTREEVQDQIVYLVMTDIRLKRLQAALKSKLPPAES